MDLPDHLEAYIIQECSYNLIIELKLLNESHEVVKDRLIRCLE